MSTTTELAATEAIKRGYRQLREDVFILVTATPDTDPDTIVAASNRLNAVMPLMEALTGRPHTAIKRSVVKRLREDGRL